MNKGIRLTIITATSVNDTTPESPLYIEYAICHKNIIDSMTHRNP
jgi:hypothetical protein